VQTEKKQINLLAEVFGPEVAPVQSGYLLGATVRDPGAFLAALAARFESIRVGVQEQVQVVLGYNFRGSVEGAESRRIAQVFTSTVANGGSGGVGLSAKQFRSACELLLRAAYLGTLLAATTLGQRRVVLTLIGGGVFGNPIPVIWEAILWAITEVEPLLFSDLDVIVNGRNLGTQVARETLLHAAQERNGAFLEFGLGPPRVVLEPR
jgi:hypothetical protein